MFGKKIVKFEGNPEHLIVLHRRDRYAKNTLVEVPKGYEVAIFEPDGTTEVIKNVYEFKLKNDAKYIYYVRSNKVIFQSKWGTPSRINVLDQEGRANSLGSYGNIEFKLMNPVRFINNRLSAFQYLDEEGLIQLVLSKLPEFFQLAIKDVEPIDASDVTGLGLAIKNSLMQNVAKRLDDMGIELVDVVVENVNLQSV